MKLGSVGVGSVDLVSVGVKSEGDNLIAGGRARRVFPRHQCLSRTLGQDRIPAQNLDVRNCSIRQYPCIQANDARNPLAL